MRVSEALASRYTCRAFLPTPVPKAEVQQVLEAARRAPSGGNLQPWRVWAMAGPPLEALKAAIRAQTDKDQLFEGEVEYAIYPAGLKEPYFGRRFRNGEGWYRALGIARDDYYRRARQVAANFELFGAPAALFLAIDRSMGPPQWLDLGIFLQSAMLAARELGLDSAPLESLSLWPKAVRGALQMPEELMLVCALALGHADPDHPVNRFRAERAPMEEIATFLGFEEAKTAAALLPG
jgi:nitroreductase